MNEDARAAELIGTMLRKKLYVLIARTAGTAETAARHPARLHDRFGKTRAAVRLRPLNEADVPPSGQGLTILRVKDAAEARRIAEAEPFFAQRLRTFELREWTVMEGTLGVRVNLSDQSVEVA